MLLHTEILCANNIKEILSEIKKNIKVKEKLVIADYILVNVVS
jgi:hypothetical protein